MSFGEKILDYKEDIIADLGELIAIQSVTGIQDGCKEALDWMMKKAISFGLTAGSINNVRVTRSSAAAESCAAY